MTIPWSGLWSTALPWPQHTLLMSCTCNLPVLGASSTRLLWLGSHAALYTQCWAVWDGSESWSHRSGQSSGSSAQHLHRSVLSALQQSALSVSEALLPPFLYMRFPPGVLQLIWLAAQCIPHSSAMAANVTDNLSTERAFPIETLQLKFRGLEERSATEHILNSDKKCRTACCKHLTYMWMRIKLWGLLRSQWKGADTVSWNDAQLHWSEHLQIDSEDSQHWISKVKYWSGELLILPISRR